MGRWPLALRQPPAAAISRLRGQARKKTHLHLKHEMLII